MRAVIDTSAWVSAVLSRGGRSAQLLRAFDEGRFSVVTSETLFVETEAVLQRPKLIASEAVRARAQSLMASLRDRAEFVPVGGTLAVCRDPNDDMVIETAISGAVDVLVSEDKDLTMDPAVTEALARFGIRVLKLAQFLDELARNE